ncbi:hypothetical protein R52603_01988 [Paraburkholderia saeva]|nr:hypothetical protein R52603_01988 [Paraburkholderia saeva]
MHVVHVPSPQDEASRQLMRDRGQLPKEVRQHRDRMRKLLATLGCWDDVDCKAFSGRLACNAVKCHDGAPLPPELSERLLRECERLALAEQQLVALEKTRQANVPAPARKRSHDLTRLKGIGEAGASRLALELFWREFSNRRQVGACVGLVPQPYDSGGSQVDQGISKQGDRRVRALLVEMAWTWVRYQPGSALTQWFNRRTQGTGPNRRARRIAIVAVARRLAIALWRYPKDGTIPEGAQMKVAGGDSMVRDRTKTSNQMHGFLLEFGISLPVGQAVIRRLPAVLAEHSLPPHLVAILERLHAHFKYLSEQIGEIDKEMGRQLADDDLGQRLLTIPGVGPITASVLAAEMGDGKQYGCGRDFAASVGLVPRQYSTGGKANLLGISRRVDKNIRRLLVLCARAFMRQVDKRTGCLAEWVRAMLTRRHSNVVACALANKLARTAWAITAHHSVFDAGLASSPA